MHERVHRLPPGGRDALRKYASGIFFAKAGSTLCLRPGPKAVAVGDWGRARYYKVNLNSKSRGLLPSRYACHLPPGGRLFFSLIITKIGRENKFSADFYVSRTVEDAGPYNLVNILMRRSVNGFLFFTKYRTFIILYKIVDSHIIYC